MEQLGPDEAAGVEQLGPDEAAVVPAATLHILHPFEYLATPVDPHNSGLELSYHHGTSSLRQGRDELFPSSALTRQTHRAGYTNRLFALHSLRDNLHPAALLSLVLASSSTKELFHLPAHRLSRPYSLHRRGDYPKKNSIHRKCLRLFL